MRIKTIIAPTMNEALARVRNEFGSDAIIIGTQNGGQGSNVHLTVAVEPTPLAPTLPAETTPAPTPQAETTAIPTQESAATPDAAQSIGQYLDYHGVPAALGARILKTLDAFTSPTAEGHLSQIFDVLFRFAPVVDIPAKPIFLIGPAGAGKTATLAKLAARAVLAGNPAQIITTDVARAGGIEQLQAFTRTLERPLWVAENPEDLTRLIVQDTDPRNAPAIFIDSQGTNPLDSKECAALADFVAAADAEPILVLAAGGAPEEMTETALAFAEIGVKRLIATRLDASRRYGGVLAAAHAANLAFAEIGISPYLGDGLARVNANILAQYICRTSSPAQTPVQQRYAAS